MPHTSDRKPDDVPTQEERETNPVGSSEEEASSNIPPRPSDHPAPTRCNARASRLARQAATNVNETVLVPGASASSTVQLATASQAQMRRTGARPTSLSGKLRLLTIR